MSRRLILFGGTTAERCCGKEQIYRSSEVCDDQTFATIVQ